MKTSLWVGCPLEFVSHRTQTLLPLLLLCLTPLSLDFIPGGSSLTCFFLLFPNLLICSVNDMLNCLLL